MNLSSDPSARACAVCGRVLDQQGDTYIHSIAGRADEKDHPPVPVPYDEIPEQLRPRCDFCFADFPTHTLVAIPLSMPGTDDLVQWDAEWAACEVCAHLIESNQWPLLTRRALASYRERYGDMHEETATNLRVVMYQLRKNMRDFYRGLEANA